MTNVLEIAVAALEDIVREQPQVSLEGYCMYCDAKVTAREALAKIKPTLEGMVRAYHD